MIDSLVNLILKLLSERQTNRQLVHKQFVEPIRSELGKLHAEYLANLSKYKELLRSESSALDVPLADLVERHHDLAIALRAQLRARTSSLTKVSSERIDDLDQHVLRFVHAIAEYLEGRDIEDAFDLLRQGELQGIVEIKNPIYTSIQFSLRSARDRVLTTAWLDKMLVGIQHRYSKFQEATSNLETFLLS